jgi:hypothetical protein
VSRAAASLAAAWVALVPAACAPLNTTARGRTAAAGVAQAERTHELPSKPRAGASPQGHPSPDPERAVRAFADAYINWTAATVTARLRALAGLSVGQARAAMTLAASETARDYELRRGGVANHGTVEVVARLRPGQYVVVTRELTSASVSDAYRGLRPAWHVALATVTRVAGGGWALSGWQPEN